MCIHKAVSCFLDGMTYCAENLLFILKHKLLLTTIVVLAMTGRGNLLEHWYLWVGVNVLLMR